MTSRRLLSIALLCAIPLTSAAAETAAGLGGSRSSMRRQHNVAKNNNFTFLRSPRQVREFVRREHLVKLEGNADYVLGKVSFPYARDAVKLFVERLAAQYHAATGDRLVVTSLTRPVSRQPRNASPLSVHPAGMAVDFRVPKKQAHRLWLERALLDLEDRNVLDATRERRPAHYHVAVFPREYSRYVASLEKKERTADAAPAVDLAIIAALAEAPIELPANESPADEPPLSAALFGLSGIGSVGAALGLRRRRNRTDEHRRREQQHA